jgi:hypothetical protein
LLLCPTSCRRFFDQQQPGSGPHLRAQQVAQTWLELAGDLTQRMLRPAFDVVSVTGTGTLNMLMWISLASM